MVTLLVDRKRVHVHFSFDFQTADRRRLQAHASIGWEGIVKPSSRKFSGGVRGHVASD